MGESVSVDLGDLRAFVDAGPSVARSIGRHGATLWSRPAGVVAQSAQVPAELGRQMQSLLASMADTDRFVVDIATAVQQIDLGFGPGIVDSFPRLIDATLDREIPDAAGLSAAEQAQRRRAFALGRAETAALLAGSFEAVAGTTGAADQLTIDDLQAAATDARLPQSVRDAAYRLAADATLRAAVDVAAQSDLGGGSPGSFDRHEVDGVVAHDDLARFGLRDHQARVLAAWGPLIDTADRDYDLSTADSLVGPGAVEAFVNDPEIPVHVRLAVFDTYAEAFDLSLDVRETIEGEYAFVDGVQPRTVLEARSRAVPGAAWAPVGSGNGMRAPAGRAPSGSAGGAGAGIVAGLLVEAVTFGWEQGSRLKATANGDPAVVHIDPATGDATRFELDELAGLSPSERKAWVAHVAAYGEPPPAGRRELGPWPYLDADGTWRWSDTNEVMTAPESSAVAARPPNPDWVATPIVLPPPGTHHDPNGNLVYDDDGSFYDGYELSPSERGSEPLTESELRAIEEYTGGLYYAVNQALRGRIPPTETSAHITLHLELGLDKVPQWTGGPVYRGSNFLPGLDEADLQPGARIRDAAFWSTTHNQHRSFEGRYQFMIRSSTSGRMVEHLSTHAHEDEVLFPPDTAFEVESVDYVGDEVRIVLNEYEEGQ